MPRSPAAGARPKRMMIAYAGLIAATVGLFWVTPTGFIPAQDQGYFLTVIQLPPGSSLAHRRGDAQGRRAHPADPGRQGIGDARRLRRPVADARPQRGRRLYSRSILRGAQEARRHLPASWRGAQGTADINEARLLIVPPPLIQGIGSAGGYRMMVEDRGGAAIRRSASRQRADRQGQPDQGPQADLHLLRHRHAARLRRYRPAKADCSACRRSACSRRCRSISARPSSTTSTCSAAPIA
jgi:hypothetical protein